MTLNQIVKRIIKRKGQYRQVAVESGLTYWQIINIVSGRTTDPRLEVWNALLKWAEKN